MQATRMLRYGMAIALVTCIVRVAAAQPSDWEPDKRRVTANEKFDEVFRELNLTPEQQQKIAEQRSKEKDQAQALQEQSAATRSKLQQELEQPIPDKAKVYALIAEMKESMGKRLEQRVERIFALQEILTPEQFKVLQEKTKERGFLKKEGRREKTNRDGACRRRFGDGDSNA